jgi:hypothetical protein
MAHRITDDELRSYLEATSKSGLIAWLMERCDEDEKLRASLLDLVSVAYRLEQTRITRGFEHDVVTGVVRPITMWYTVATMPR